MIRIAEYGFVRKDILDQVEHIAYNIDKNTFEFYRKWYDDTDEIVFVMNNPSFILLNDLIYLTKKNFIKINDDQAILDTVLLQSDFVYVKDCYLHTRKGDLSYKVHIKDEAEMLSKLLDIFQLNTR